ncbi:hypothetical protein [uncultured Ruminococcus sp.]|uniref:hypothetical protein n=1 Tax=uncultured Ruminococcus sp. TaxID=165186 RepID=UPI0025DF3616|nr:hypothetical protein [uncultured Ruminococcus sp.]
MTIEKYLDNIFEQLKREVNDMSTLCVLKDVNYQHENIPDYSNAAVQLLYCLRYHFGYACEYEKMYENILSKLDDKSEISVLSIGCGNGIDLWALQDAINRRNIDLKINYYGIDYIDWSNKINGRDCDNVNYVTSNINDIEDSIDDLTNIDVLIFPKSISEIQSSDLIHIANFISRRSKTLYVMASYRNSDYALDQDIDKIKELCTYLKRSGFTLSDSDPECYYCYEDKEKGIRSIYYDYIYPNEVIDYISKLYDKCNYYDRENNVCNICTDSLSRRPILTLRNIAYNILTFNSIDL